MTVATHSGRSCCPPSAAGSVQRGHTRLAPPSFPSVLCARAQPSAPSSACSASRAASGAGASQVAAISASPVCMPGAPASSGGIPCWVAPAAIVAATTCISWAIAGSRRSKTAYDPLATVLAAQRDCQGLTADGPSHQRALARTRMSSHIARCIDLNRRGENMKAHSELLLALAENDACRSPSFDGAHTKEERYDLYRLYIRYCDATPSFGVLLQLQLMLEMTQEEGAAVEQQIMTSAKDFCI
ncbi:hypothetical protein FOA52_004728 [Chlamydomonas sp. UWO 241]|nr:hypothetical protein FOA52_004728 [Chlamydomonas sp. UWO 241]